MIVWNDKKNGREKSRAGKRKILEILTPLVVGVKKLGEWVRTKGDDAADQKKGGQKTSGEGEKYRWGQLNV